MLEITLTNQQKKYLLYYHQANDVTSITQFADHFKCSRTNSKKILDRMVKLGVFYKAANHYLLTALGEHLIKDQLNKCIKVARVIEVIFDQDPEASADFAKDVITSETVGISNLLLNKYNMVCNLPKAKTTVDVTDFEKMFEYGNYTLMYQIYKQRINANDLLIPLSMANGVFLEDATLSIGDTSYILLTAISLSRAHQGYKKSGSIHEVEYISKDGMQTISPVNGVFKLPLTAVHTWHYIGQGVFCANIWLNNKASISFARHANKSNYLFMINMFAIK